MILKKDLSRLGREDSTQQSSRAIIFNGSVIIYTLLFGSVIRGMFCFIFCTQYQDVQVLKISVCDNSHCQGSENHMPLPESSNWTSLGRGWRTPSVLSIFLPQSSHGYQMSRAELCNMVATTYMWLKCHQPALKCTASVKYNPVFQRQNKKSNIPF